MLSFEKQIDAKGSTNGSKLTISHSEQEMQPGVEKTRHGFLHMQAMLMPRMAANL